MKKNKKVVHYSIISAWIFFGVFTQDLLATLKLGLIIFIILTIDSMFSNDNNGGPINYV